MGKATKIEWCDFTFNPWRGCSKVAPGCTNCYAESHFSVKLHGIKWGTEAQGGTRVRKADWSEPVRWNRAAQRDLDDAIRAWELAQPHKPGGDIPHKRPRVFCASLADVFEDWDGPVKDHKGLDVYQCVNCNTYETGRYRMHCEKCGTFAMPVTLSDLRRDLFALIDATPNLDWILLTKRPENVLPMWPSKSMGLGPINPELSPRTQQALAETNRSLHDEIFARPNVWLLTSVSDQPTADKQIPELLKCRDLVPVLGLSCEPLLNEIDLSEFFRASHENQPNKRTALSGSGEGGVVLGGRSGEDLETQETDRRRIHPDSNTNASETDAGRDGEIEGLSSSPVHMGGGAEVHLRAAGRVASSERSDSRPDRSKSQRRRQAIQRPEKSGVADPSGEQAPCVPGIGSQDKRAAGRTQPGSTSHIEGDTEDQGTVIAGSDASENCQTVRRESIDDFGRDPGQDLGLWVICGGESGKDARPCDVAWIRSIVEQCAAAGTSCFVKQLGAHVVDSDAMAEWPVPCLETHPQQPQLKDPKGGDPSEWMENLRVRQFPNMEVESAGSQQKAT